MPLYLASQSRARKILLELAGIPYQTIAHTSDECGIEATGSFEDYVLAIAQHKMAHIVPPDTQKSMLVLTADTLMQTKHTQNILGKPQNRDDAVAMLSNHEPVIVATACCLEKKHFDGTWQTTRKIHWVTTAELEFYVDDIDAYLTHMPHALHACGAGIIEDYGINFLKSVHGSYTAIRGLPIFELRQHLKKIS